MKAKVLLFVEMCNKKQYFFIKYIRFSDVLLSPHGESLILCRLHYLALARTFVVDAAEVENAVYNDAVQFLLVCLAKQLGVGAYGVE